MNSEQRTRDCHGLEMTKDPSQMNAMKGFILGPSIEKGCWGNLGNFTTVCSQVSML